MKTTIIRPLLLALLFAWPTAYAETSTTQTLTTPLVNETSISENKTGSSSSTAKLAEDLPVGEMLKKDFEVDINSNIELLIPIFGIVFTFGTPIAIIWIIAAYSARRRRLNHETIEKFINAGLPIPNELLADTKPSSGSDSARHKGVIMTFLGLALLIMLSELADHQVATIALIPMFLGIAYLVSWNLTKNDAKNGQVE